MAWMAVVSTGFSREHWWFLLTHFTQNGNEVYVAAVPRGTSAGQQVLPQSLRHRRQLTDIFWRDNAGQ